MSFNCLSERHLLVAKIGRRNIINICKYLLNSRFFLALCNLNCMQYLKTPLLINCKVQRKNITAQNCSHVVTTDHYHQNWTKAKYSKNISKFIKNISTCFLRLLRSSSSSDSPLHHPSLSSHFLNLVTGFFSIFHCSISSAARYLVESSDVEWWPAL